MADGEIARSGGLMRRLYHVVRSCLAVVGLIVLGITFTPVLGWWVQALSANWGPDRGSTLIVLGSENIAPDMLGQSSYWRAWHAVVAWRTGKFDRILVSGYEVAPVMRDLMVNQGVPKDRILVENRAQSTRENALYCKALLGGQSGGLVVLTGDFHAGRAVRVFERVGLPVTALPYPDARKRLVSRAERWGVFVGLVEESVKVAYYWLRGWG